MLNKNTLFLEISKLSINCAHDKKTCSKISKNFGGYFPQPYVVVYPKKVRELEQIVNLANRLHVPIAVKGSGHSTGTQHDLVDGILIDITGLNAVGDISQYEDNSAIIGAQAGSSWRKVVNKLLQHGYMPYIFTDWLDLTLGGTLCFGGVGAASYKHGLQTDHIKQLGIVDYSGKRCEASLDKEQELFHAARAGYGQFGIFTDFQIKVRKCLEYANLFIFVYRDIETLINDALFLNQKKTHDGVLIHIEPYNLEKLALRYGFDLDNQVFSTPAFLNKPWVIVMELTQFSKDKILKMKSNNEIGGKLVNSMSYLTSTYLNRIPPILDAHLEEIGQGHVEFIYFLPFSVDALALVKYALDAFSPADLGQGLMLIIPLDASLIHTPYFMHPAQKHFFLFGILARVKNQKHRESLQNRFKHLAEQALLLGGVRYPCDSIPTKDWSSHYQDKWQDLQRLKHKYDPQRLFSPGLFKVKTLG